MQVNYELTQKDFYQSFIAHRNRNRFSKWSLRLAVFVVLLFAALCLLLLVFSPDIKALHNFMPMFGVAALWVAILWGCPWLAARSQFSRQPAAHGEKSVTVDTTGVHWKWDGGASDIEWKNFIRCVEAKDNFLLYSSPVCFNIVPKRAFAPEQLEEFRTVLNQHIHSK